MSPGNFSNGGVATFDEHKRYVGVRLQQGVPLLDRDWNELEDIRRFFEQRAARALRRRGRSRPDGFEVKAPEFDAENDVLIGAGNCSVAGFDVWSEQDVLFSEQGDLVPLPAPDPAGDTLVLYLEPEVVLVDSTVDPDLRNAQDVNMETCLRDQLRWAVRAVRRPELPPPGTYVLAEITRTAADTQIRPELIADRRRTMLSLADAVDRLGSAEHRLDALEDAVQHAQLDIETMRQDLNRLLWDVRVEASTADTLFGGQATVTVTVTDRNGDPVQGATVSFATDWGWLTTSVAVTGANGKVSVQLIGVYWDPRPAGGRRHPPARQPEGRRGDAPGSGRGRVREGAVRAGGAGDGLALQHAGPPARPRSDLPPAPIVAQPELRTATVTVHASLGSVVRGVGSVQVRFGVWIRDWLRTKIVDVTKQVTVGARIGDVLRQGFVEDVFDHTVVTGKLPSTLQSIQDETQARLKEHLFVNPQLSDADVVGSGLLVQVVAQHATTAVGARTNSAIETQLNQFVAATDVPLDATQAATARTNIVQQSTQITAGFAQSHKQLFSVTRVDA